MTPVQRRKKSDDEKRKNGEKRLNTWIPKEGAEALAALVSEDGASEREVITAALVEAASALPPKKNRKRAA